MSCLRLLCIGASLLGVLRAAHSRVLHTHRAAIPLESSTRGSSWKEGWGLSIENSNPHPQWFSLPC